MLRSCENIIQKGNNTYNIYWKNLQDKWQGLQKAVPAFAKLWQ